MYGVSRANKCHELSYTRAITQASSPERHSPLCDDPRQLNLIQFTGLREEVVEGNLSAPTGRRFFPFLQRMNIAAYSVCECCVKYAHVTKMLHV